MATRSEDVKTQAPMTGQAFSALDDYPIHQTSQTFGMSGSGEPEWFEHDAAYVVPPGMQDRPYFVHWFQFKPNQDSVQAWVMMNHKSTQWNLVLWRSLSSDRGSLSIGPLTTKIIEPLRRYSFTLREDAGYPFSYDLLLEARNRPYLYDKRVYADDASGFNVEHAHTDQSLRVREGSITVQGETYDASGFFALRDHCWGRRAGPNVDRGFHVPLTAHFGDRTLAFWYEELADGTPLYAVGHIETDTGENMDIVAFEHDMEYEPNTGNFSVQRWRLTDERGRDHQLVVRRLVNGGFQRYNEILGERLHHSGEGGPDRGGMQGMWLQALDLSDESVLQGPYSHEQRQQYCEMQLDGEVGYGMCIYYTSPRHPKYGPAVRGTGIQQA
jgi:hypothetical protein